MKNKTEETTVSNLIEPVVIKPCPFCGCSMELNAVGRDWWRIEPIVWHQDECPIDEQTFDYSQSLEKQEAIEIWNVRSL
jgi:hypothetical protein